MEYIDNYQDNGGCSINGIRFFLVEEGIVEDLDDFRNLLNRYDTIQDYRGYPIQLRIDNFESFPLSDEILRMKNVHFIFRNQSKPIHQLVSPEPHFVEKERNLIENHFKYLEEMYENDDIEEWDCFEMDCEGHLVSIISDESKLQFTNESIEHLSNFPHLRNLNIVSSPSIKESVTNFSLLSNLANLSISFFQECLDPDDGPELLDDLDMFEHRKFVKDLGLFTNLIYLDMSCYYGF